jgi:hypothetical protein
MNVKAYAESRGVSHVAVLKAIKQGRIKSARKVGTRWEVDPDAADREWKANTQTGHHSSKAPDVEDAPPERRRNSIPAYADSRALREAYTAQLAKLEYEEKAGKLVRVDDVKVTWFTEARRTRDAILNVPIRIVDEVAAIAGDLSAEQRHEILLCLQRELIQALEELSGGDSQRP